MLLRKRTIYGLRCEYVGQYYILDARVVILVAVAIIIDIANIDTVYYVLSYRLDIN